MFKRLSVIGAMLIVASLLSAQTRNVSRDSKNSFVLKENTDFKLRVINKTEDVSFSTASTPSGVFTVVEIPGFTGIYNIGKPQLPVVSKLIELPLNAIPVISIKASSYNDIDLTKAGYPSKILPCQPSYSKSADPSDMIFKYDEAFYNTDAFNLNDLVSVEENGTVRGVRTGRLVIAPFRYNPVKNILRIYKNIEFEVTFPNADIAKTKELKQKFYSPAFSPIYSSLINYKPIAKESITTYPITYVIVSPQTFQTTLQPFIQWKTRKGFNVIEAYTNNSAVGTTTTSIKAYLEGLYNAGTPANPAPSYVLFVGDVAQIPSFSGTTGSHVSDMYYCEYDGGSDYIPDVYYGRFSATSVAQLQSQIDKTLLYERYMMDNTAYLDTVVLVAGVDASWAPTHANGQINYGTSNYFNASNGIYSHTFLYPASQSHAAQIRADIGKGVGFANYTAHCNSNGWGDPSFTTSHIPAMNNANKYGLMIGNCCLSNKFDDNECFGEGLLRAVNKGAVGYIGGSNNTLWDEDFYWGVGYTANVTANSTYAGTGLGAYDRVFHTHNEPESDWYVTNSQMIYAGNLAVQASSSSNKKYYWEIYHLMGDPSLMTYLYEPPSLQVTYTNPIIVGETTLTVQTEPGAYVAISDDNVLLCAVLADVNGTAQLTFSPFLAPDTASIVVTKQNRIPFEGTLNIINVSLALDASAAAIIEPESQYNCTGLTVAPKVILRNMGVNALQSMQINYRINTGSIVQQSWTGNLASLAADTVVLSPFTLAAGQHTIKVFTSAPNNNTDMNFANDTVVKTFVVDNLPVSALFIPSDTSFCNAPATVSFTNQSANATAYAWDFGDGFVSTESSPTHTFQSIGQYNVTLTADAGICGTNSYILPYTINVGMPAPLVNNAQNCGPASLQLDATGYGTLNWYENQGDTTPVYTGTTFTTPYLTNTETYYVQGTVTNPVKYVGKVDNTGSGSYFGNATNWHYLIFNSYVPCKLLTVKVFAQGAGNRKILLRDATGNVLDSVTVNIADGESRITLNFDIPVANNLQLVGSGAVNLFRNNNNTGVYPYEMPGLISIIESSASLPQYNTPGNYYYFYDWEVKEYDCLSVMQTATAYILDEPVSSFSHTVNGYAVQFTNTSQYAIDVLWDFGDGQTSTQLNPTHTYAQHGTYDVKLYIDNICGTDSSETQVTIQGMAPVTEFMADIVQIVTGDFVSFTDMSTYSPSSWNWIFEGGTPSSSSVQNPVIQYNTEGTYYVTLISGNTFGNGYAHKPYYISVGPASTGVVLSNNPVFNVYPNPLTSNEFTLNADGIDLVNAVIAMYNVLGKVIPIEISRSSSSMMKITADSISSGIYFLRITNGQQTYLLKLSHL